MEDEEIYGGYEEGKVNEIQGITDSVTDYTYANLSYPCIIFKSGFKLEKHKMQVISNMVKSRMNGLEKNISLYFTNEDQLYKVGAINEIQVSPLIDIAGRDCLEAYLDSKTKLENDLIFVLCGS